MLALSQGQIAATVAFTETAQASVQSGNFPGIRIVGPAPMVSDYVANFTRREEYDFLNYLDLFVNQQVRIGRYAELYAKWIGRAAKVALVVPADVWRPTAAHGHCAGFGHVARLHVV